MKPLYKMRVFMGGMNGFLIIRKSSEKLSELRRGSNDKLKSKKLMSLYQTIIQSIILLHKNSKDRNKISSDFKQHRKCEAKKESDPCLYRENLKCISDLQYIQIILIMKTSFTSLKFFSYEEHCKSLISK